MKNISEVIRCSMGRTEVLMSATYSLTLHKVWWEVGTIRRTAVSVLTLTALTAEVRYKVGPRLLELAPAARGGQEARS